MSNPDDYAAKLAAIKPAPCAYNDHGMQCRHSGLIAFSTTGGGPWYCREHADVIRGVTPAAVGNAITSRPTSQLVQDRNREWAMTKDKGYKRITTHHEEAA